MTLDTVATAHTLALFLGNLRYGTDLSITLTAGAARVHVTKVNAVWPVDRAAELLGVRTVWHARDSDRYPVEYIASGPWHGVYVAVFALFTADGWAATDVRSPWEGSG